MSLIMGLALVSGLDIFGWDVVTPQKWGELAWACLLPVPGRFNQPCWGFACFPKEMSLITPCSFSLVRLSAPPAKYLLVL